jgi:hypothetical protein
MIRFTEVVKKLFRRRKANQTPGHRPLAFRPAVECLEDRLAPSVSWNGGATGFWNVPGNWTGGSGVPTTGDVVTINGAVTVTFNASANSIASLALTGGATLNLVSNTLDITAGGDNLSLDGTSHFNLQGGTLQDATVVAAGSSALLATSSTSTLTNVTLDGTGAGNNVSPLDMQTNSDCRLNVSGNLTLKGAVIHAGNAAGTSRGLFYFIDATAQTIDGFDGTNPGTILFGASANNAIWFYQTGAVLTLGANLTITGATGQVRALAGGAFDNLGAITADPMALGLGLGSGEIILTAVDWTNHGALRAQNGGTVTLAGSWSNPSPGIISTDSNGGSTVNLGGTFATAGLGTFSHTLGGIVNLTGVLTNTALLLDSSKGSWNLKGGTITGGTVAATSTNALLGTNSGTLTGVTLDGTGGNNVSPLDMQTSNDSSVTVSGNLTLKGVVIHAGNAAGSTRGLFYFIDATAQTLDGFDGTNPGTVLFGASANNAIWFYQTGAAVLTLGANLTVTGATYQVRSLAGGGFDNLGTIAADPTALGLGLGSGTVTLTGTNWTNEGVLQAAVNGTLALTAPSGVTRNGGRLDGLGVTGTVNGVVNVNASGHLAGNTVPAVLATGDLNLNNASVYDAQLNGTTAGGASGYDQIKVTGAINLTTPTLNATLGYVPTLGDKLFIIVNKGGNPVTGTFAGLANGATLTLTSSVNSQSYAFTINYTGDSATNSATGGNDVVLICASDNFNRPDSATLGSGWQIPSLPAKFLFTYRRRLGFGDLALQNNEAVSTSSFAFTGEQVPGLSVLNPTLQADVNASNPAALAVGLMARIQSNDAAYVAVLTNTGQAQIGLFNAATNSFSVLQSQSVSSNVGTLKLVVTGDATPTLTLYFNDLVNPLFSITPTGSSIIASAGGVGIFAQGPNGIIDNFSVGGS